MNLEVAARLLDVKEDELSPFEAPDSFNGNNILSGFLCRRSDHRYGALVISRVNGWDCEQVIFGTPKIHYPFDKDGNYNWPDVKELEFWEKLDGTNILAYHYMHEDRDFVTYKTRLTPVVKDSDLVSFKSMWIEYMMGNDWVSKVIEENPAYNLSFELYGSRNPITIKYDAPLSVCLLFGVSRFDGSIKPPGQLILRNVPAKLPKLFDLQYFFDDKENLTHLYNRMRFDMSEQNKESLTIEGMVLYAHVVSPEEGEPGAHGVKCEPSWRMFQCKSEEIEKIPWTASGSIPEISLKNTALNVFEDKESPTLDDFRALLLEEYPENIITKSFHKIEGAWKWALERVHFGK
jgi:hypothetical protein